MLNYQDIPYADPAIITVNMDTRSSQETMGVQMSILQNPYLVFNMWSMVACSLPCDKQTLDEHSISNQDRPLYGADRVRDLQRGLAGLKTSREKVILNRLVGLSLSKAINPHTWSPPRYQRLRRWRSILETLKHGLQHSEEEQHTHPQMCFYSSHNHLHVTPFCIIARRNWLIKYTRESWFEQLPIDSRSVLSTKHTNEGRTSGGDTILWRYCWYLYQTAQQRWKTPRWLNNVSWASPQKTKLYQKSHLINYLDQESKSYMKW